MSWTHHDNFWPLRAGPELLRCRLLEAATWCDTFADATQPSTCLRRLPNPLLEAGMLHAEPDRVVGELLRAREVELKPMDRQQLPVHGRLLFYFPDEDLADGAAEQASGGFFDINNTPAWDSWVAFFSRPEENRFCLVAYVPEQLIALCNSGIDVNPESCIGWLNTAQTANLGFDPNWCSRVG